MKPPVRILALIANDATISHYLKRIGGKGDADIVKCTDVQSLRHALTEDSLQVLVIRAAAVLHEEDLLLQLFEQKPELRARAILLGDRRGLDLGLKYRLPDPPFATSLEQAIHELAFPPGQEVGINEAPNPAARRLLTNLINFTRQVEGQESVWTRGLNILLDASGAEAGAILAVQPLSPGGFEVLKRTGKAFEQLADDLRDKAVLSLLQSALAQSEPERHPAGTPLWAGGEILAVRLMNRRNHPLGVALLAAQEGTEFSDAAAQCAGFAAQFFGPMWELMRRLEEGERLAVIDSLTGLYNRRFFDRMKDVELQRAVRSGRPLTLALIDLDHFKSINDRLGYAEGDRVIRRVATLLRGNFREVDYVMRWGGDEFAVLLPDTGFGEERASTDFSTTFALLERIRLRVSDADFEDLKTGRPLSLSIGAATFPRDARDAEELFHRANEALQEAKRSGRNRVAVAGRRIFERGTIGQHQSDA